MPTHANQKARDLRRNENCLPPDRVSSPIECCPDPGSTVVAPTAGPNRAKRKLPAWLGVPLKSNRRDQGVGDVRRTTVPPDSQGPISVTSLAGAPVAQHGVKLTTLGAGELQAPKPRVRMMANSAIVTFIWWLYARLPPGRQSILRLPEQEDAEPPQLRARPLPPRLARQCP